MAQCEDLRRDPQNPHKTARCGSTHLQSQHSHRKMGGRDRIFRSWTCWLGLCAANRSLPQKRWKVRTETQGCPDRYTCTCTHTHTWTLRD